MTMKTRRLLAATLTSALVAAPALVCSGPAQATTAAPASLLGDLVGSGSSTTQGSTLIPGLPVPSLPGLDAVTEILAPILPTGTEAPDPLATVTGIVTGVATAVLSGDPTQVTEGLTDQLLSLGASLDDITSVLDALTPEQMQNLTDGLLGAMPLDQLFASTGGTIPQPIADILNLTGAQPTDTAGLIAAMTAFYQAKGQTKPDDAATKALHKSALQALLLALSKKTTTPKPPATGPSAACTSATKKVTKLKKQLKLAKRKHLRVKAKRLSKKLTRAKMAKIRAC
ncbi:MAG: hypothetical protein ACXVD1_03590 [Nocardioides sp.]